ncbi:MAG: secretion protein HlyD, partial [Pedobacter sp.]|nr:secretion protein HlyD [Pedobacter sp.]
MYRSYDDTVVHTNLVFLHQTGLRSQLIYSITLFGMVLAFGSTPFIYTTISVKSIGLIQSAGEKMELLAPIGGRLLYVNLADNQRVAKGSTLLIIDGVMFQQQ